MATTSDSAIENFVRLVSYDIDGVEWSIAGWPFGFLPPLLTCERFRSMCPRPTALKPLTSRLGKNKAPNWLQVYVDAFAQRRHNEFS